MVSTNASGGSIAYGKAIQGSGSGAGVPTLSHNGFGKSVSDPDLLQIDADYVITTGASASSGPPVLQNVGGLDLDWGRWDHVQIDEKVGSAAHESATAGTEWLHWAVFKPANMASTTGTVHYGNNSVTPLIGVDESGGALHGGVIEFDVDFDGGAITNGSMVLFDSANDTWNVTFDGHVHDSFAQMTNVSGTFGGTASVTGVIGGAFVDTGTTNATPDFITGFSLQSGSSFVQGMSLLNNEDCFTCEVGP